SASYSPIRAPIKIKPGDVAIAGPKTRRILFRSVRAEPARLAVTNHVAEAVNNRPARPVAARASIRRWLIISRVRLVAGDRVISARIGVGVGNCGSNDNAAENSETDAAAAATRIGSGRRQRRSCQHRGRSDSEQSLFHMGRLLMSVRQAPT